MKQVTPQNPEAEAAAIGCLLRVFDETVGEKPM